MKYSENQALSKIASFCSKAERAEYDIRRKLKDWEIEGEVIVRIISYLKKENFLNEERYCRSFIKDKLRFNKWGETKIKYELKKKQVPSDIIDLCFDELDDNEFNDPLTLLLRNKMKTIKAANDYEKKIKLIRFGLGRGYSIQQIKSCMNKILDHNNDEYFEHFY